MESETEAGFITGSGLGELSLMGGKHYLLVTPSVTIYLTKAAKGCTLPLENTVAGNTVFELPEALTALVPQSINTIPQMELELLFPSDVLTYGAQTAWLDGGNAQLHLSGALIGEPWGAE